MSNFYYFLTEYFVFSFFIFSKNNIIYNIFRSHTKNWKI